MDDYKISMSDYMGAELIYPTPGIQEPKDDGEHFTEEEFDSVCKELGMTEDSKYMLDDELAYSSGYKFETGNW